MKTQSNDLPVDKVFWPSSIRVPVGSNSFDSFVGLIADRCIVVSRKALRPSEKKKYRMASRWFLYGLLQSHFSIPSVPLAMPMSPEDYGKSGIYQIPFGFKILKKIIQVSVDLALCSQELGVYNPYGKGKITRLKPAGDLLDEFHSTGIKWEFIEPPPKYQAVCMRMNKRDKEIRYVDRRVSAHVARMQDIIFDINGFLSRQCISIDLPNAALHSWRAWYKKNADADAIVVGDYVSEGRNASLSMQEVFIRRSFCRGSLELGGRFYGGWWQSIPSKLRRRILINGDRTVECDYSGLVFALLYAREGLELGTDPYDLGSVTDTVHKRKLVKKFMIASLNDEAGKYRLSKLQLSQLGLSHSRLVKLVSLKHAGIKDYFASGIGLQMQYLDSQLAERVMLRMKEYGEVCLPVHDSFIVRQEVGNLLKSVMLEAFNDLHGKSIAVRLERGFNGISLSMPRQSLLKSTVSIDALIKKYIQHSADYSVVCGFLNSWESASFTPEALVGRDIVLNEARALAKDSGKYFHDEYKFNGIPVFMRHLGMPHSSSSRETDPAYKPT